MCSRVLSQALHIWTFWNIIYWDYLMSFLYPNELKSFANTMGLLHILPMPFETSSICSICDELDMGGQFLCHLDHLTPLHFFVWAFLKHVVYCTEVICLQDFSSRLDVAIIKVRNDVSHRAAIKVRNDVSHRATIVSMRKWARACIRCAGGQFQQQL